MLLGADHGCRAGVRGARRHSPPKGAIAIAHAVCELAGCPQVPDWLHSLEKQIAAGQLTVEEAVLMVIDFDSDLDDAQP